MYGDGFGGTRLLVEMGVKERRTGYRGGGRRRQREGDKKEGEGRGESARARRHRHAFEFVLLT